MPRSTMPGLNSLSALILVISPTDVKPSDAYGADDK